MKKHRGILAILASVAVFMVTCAGCGEEVKPDPKSVQEEPAFVPVFSADSAYAYVKKQVDFGPRVPNTAPHKECASWLAEQLRTCGANVIEQKGKVKAWNGAQLDMINVIGQFNPGAKRRILLCSHWDTRPYADKDSLESNWRKPILGANDGASGVGVLLEVARQLQAHPLGQSIGVDIIFFDAEDYGKPEFEKDRFDPDADPNAAYEEAQKNMLTWCLGSQYWSRNPHIGGYRAQYGILLDMVGARHARFYQEGYSMRYAPDIVSRVWNAAYKGGYGNVFVKEQVGGVFDDHIPLNEIAGIKTIDIIQYGPSVNVMGLQPEDAEETFGFYHHTIFDNMDIIDPATLGAVGQTVLSVIYSEK